MKRKNNIQASLQTGKLWLLAVLALATTAMTACADDEEVQPAPGTLAVQTVSSGAEATTFAGESVTRATVSQPAVGSSIGVFRKADSYYTTAANNVKYTRGASGWVVATPGTDIKLASHDCRVLLYAYYPYHTNIVVGADQQSVTLGSRMYDDTYDLCYVPAGNAVATDAGGLVYNFHPGVQFDMKHAYTQVAVSLTRGDNYGAPGTVTAMSLTLNGGGRYYSSGTQNIATGTYTPGTAGISKIDYTVSAGTKLTPTKKNVTLGYMLPPGVSGALTNLTLSVTADGVTTTAPVSVTGLDMLAGKRYLVKVTLDYRSLDVRVVTTDWDSQSSFDGGEAGFGTPDPVAGI